MDRSTDLFDSQIFPASDAIDFALPSERSYVPSHEDATKDATNENLDGCEQENLRLTPVDELLKVEHWKPAEPQYCKEIAAHYGQSKRTIQKWFVDLREIAPWFSEPELRLSDDRYTLLAVELLGHRYFAGSKKKWESVLRELFAERIAAANSQASDSSAIRPDVLPSIETDSQNGDRPTMGGCFLLTGNNFLAALQEEEMELAEVEAKELRLLGRLGEGLERLTHASSQWDRASQLRKQRLIRQTRLEAASLAVELEEEFENTLRETQYQIQRGNIPAPGKPQSESSQPQSA